MMLIEAMETLSCCQTIFVLLCFGVCFALCQSKGVCVFSDVFFCREITINETLGKWTNKRCSLVREPFCFLFSLISHKRLNATKNIFPSFEDSGYSPGSVAGRAGGGAGRSDLLDDVEFSDPLMFGS